MTHTGGNWGLASLLRDPQQALSSHSLSNILGSLQRPLSTGQADWVTVLPRLMEGPTRTWKEL